jgi:ferredoxin
MRKLSRTEERIVQSGDWVRRVRDVHKFHQQEGWRKSDYSRDEWIAKVWPKSRRAYYDVLGVGIYLGHLQDKDLKKFRNQTNCYYLARYAYQARRSGRKVDKALVRKIQPMKCVDCKLYLDKKLPGTSLSDVRMGATMHFRGMNSEPLNEQGVVLLFGMVCQRLGFEVEVVQTRFPDCVAKKQVGKRDWRNVSIEFEYRSSDFVKHAHDRNKCDLVVCWEDDLEGSCPVKVLELREEIKSLSRSTPAA